jgi:hypothetical protein
LGGLALACDYSLQLISSVLSENGFSVKAGEKPFDLVAESQLTFVAVKSFLEIAEVAAHWRPLQTCLSETYYGHLDPAKLWDTYLVLVVHETGERHAQALHEILRNTAYCRKLVLYLDPTDDRDSVAWGLLPLIPIKWGSFVGHGPTAAELMVSMLLKRLPGNDRVQQLVASEGEPVCT